MGLNFDLQKSEKPIWVIDVCEEVLTQTIAPCLDLTS